jgi:hypothetical protein
MNTTVEFRLGNAIGQGADKELPAPALALKSTGAAAKL